MLFRQLVLASLVLSLLLSPAVVAVYGFVGGSAFVGAVLAALAVVVIVFR